MKLNHSLITLLLLITSTAFAHDDSFKPEFVDTLIAPYLQIQTGLAADDLDEAKKGADAFLKAMAHAPKAESAKEEVADFIAPATLISKAKDIKAVRAAFLDLSMNFKALVTHVGTSDKTPLFVAYCPMAFDNKGGVWLQSDKTVNNPYYGAMMLRCGGIKEQIAGKKEADHDSHSHGHDHGDHHHH